MKKIPLVLLALLAACASGSTIMTNQAFFDIPIGTSQTDVVTTAGEPYAIHRKEDGTTEYEYIERVKIGGRNAQVRRYYLVIKDGKVVSKRVEQSSPAPYLFDSYEMQTTQTATDPE